MSDATVARPLLSSFSSYDLSRRFVSFGFPQSGEFLRSAVIVCLSIWGSVSMAQSVVKPVSVPSEPGETHLRNIRQLTNGGENAEAYFSHDGRQLIFQSTRDARTCDQQYVMRIDGSHVRRVSSGRGKTTCGYFMGGDRRIFFASSEALERDCPPRPDASKGYVWRLDPFDIYTARPDGSRLRRLTRFGVYTAEGVLSPDGSKIVFTSLKDGDLDIYVMSVDGSNVKQLTHQLGYDGGPWWSPVGKRIVYGAFRERIAAVRVVCIAGCGEA